MIDVVKACGADPADNGHDDRPALEKAIREAAPGDEVYLPNGVYNLSSPWSSDLTTNFRLRSGVNLRGESENGTCLKPSLSRDGNIKNYACYGIKGVESGNLVLSNFTLTWNRRFSVNTKNNNSEGGGPTYAIATAENEEPAGNPRHCIVKGNLLIGNTVNRVVRGPGISEEDWLSNKVQ